MNQALARATNRQREPIGLVGCLLADTSAYFQHLHDAIEVKRCRVLAGRKLFEGLEVLPTNGWAGTSRWIGMLRATLRSGLPSVSSA
jgi:hypothetical protein